MLTGERPFEGGMSAIMHKALNTEPPAPSQLSVTAPPSFDAVVRRAMAKRPEDRFASASAFAEAMRAAMANPSAPVSEDEATMVAAPSPAARAAAAPPVRAVPARQPGRGLSTPIMAAAGLVVLAAVGGGTWWYLEHSAATEPVIGTASSAAQAAKPDTASVNPVPAVSVATEAPTPPPAPISAEAAPTPAPVAAPPTASAPPPAPPPAPAPTVQPNTQLAAAGVSGLRNQVAQWAASADCALLGGDVRDGDSVLVSGLASSRAVQELRQGLTALAPSGQIDWRVNGVDQAFCPTLDALRPAVAAFGSSGPRLGLQMADGKSRLHDGEAVRVHVLMPDFAGTLRVDYVAHDGSVQHLYPQLADPKAHIRADAPRSYAPGEAVNLSNPAWTISEPYGTDMIIAVASSAPLFASARPDNAESADSYLRDLQAAIETARQRGVRLAGAAVTLEALPK
jgi:eukaryotic-like serine/threonine-protein kinase